MIVTAAGGGDPTGAVGICTTSIPTGFKLAVNGKIVCEEIKVKLHNTWDCVFSNDYSLLTLQKVDEFIRVNHHLPNIPSEKEMKADGNIAVGDLQMQLLRKVEELTLYIIDQDKRIGNLQSELQNIKDNK